MRRAVLLSLLEKAAQGLVWLRCVCLLPLYHFKRRTKYGLRYFQSLVITTATASSAMAQ